MKERKKTRQFLLLSDLQFFLPEKKLAIRDEIFKKEYNYSFLKDITNNKPLKDSESKSTELASNMKTLRYPILYIPSKTELLNLTRVIAKSVNQNPRTKLIFSAKLDILTEKIILKIERHDYPFRKIEMIDQFLKDLKIFFFDLVGEFNAIIIEYRKNKSSIYEIKISYLHLLNRLNEKQALPCEGANKLLLK